jgi:hypothetical protein
LGVFVTPILPFFDGEFLIGDVFVDTFFIGLPFIGLLFLAKVSGSYKSKNASSV